MNRMISLMFLTVLVFAFSASAVSAAPKVVIIPMKSSPGPQEKELYIPATAFRPVSNFLSGSWQQYGAMIKPNGAGYWNAPLLLATGTHIVSLELFWMNNVHNTGISYVILHLLNLVNGGTLQMVTTSSQTALAGVQSVKTNSINAEIGEDLKYSVLVYLSNEERWLMGVKVVYSE